MWYCHSGELPLSLGRFLLCFNSKLGFFVSFVIGLLCDDLPFVDLDCICRVAVLIF